MSRSWKCVSLTPSNKEVAVQYLILELFSILNHDASEVKRETFISLGQFGYGKSELVIVTELVGYCTGLFLFLILQLLNDGALTGFLGRLEDRDC